MVFLVEKAFKKFKNHKNHIFSQYHHQLQSFRNQNQSHRMNISQTDIPTKFLLQDQKPEFNQTKQQIGQWQKNKNEETPKSHSEQTFLSRQIQLRLKKSQCALRKVNSKSQEKNHAEFVDDRVQKFIYLSSLQKIERKQLYKQNQRKSSLKSQSRHILCKIASIIILICLFFMVLLKIFLFFSNQFIGTVIQSFKSQLFDPAITNDELQLEIFYIEEACFVLTSVLLFMFVLFCTLMAKKYYVGSLRVYRRNRRVIAKLNQERKDLKTKIFRQVQCEEYQLNDE